MSQERVFSLKNRWFTVCVGSVLLVAVLSALIGFVWLPMAQARQPGTSLWDAICRAAGVVQPSRAWQQSATPVKRPTDVIVTANMMAPADALSIGRGATLAMQCTMCHGARGVSLAGSPNLAGQPDSMIYKQLRDFKAGHRINAIMQSMAANLDDPAMRDLAAYYASLPHEPSVVSSIPRPVAPVLVRNGAPMRGIAACAGCHAQTIYRTATPHLNGQPQSYIETQLNAFASGARGNDINSQMRNVARHMTPAEIVEVAAYYAAQ